MVDTTIYNNRADADGDTSGDGGGITFVGPATPATTLELGNSIIAGNLSSASSSYPDVSGVGGMNFISRGFNLIGDNTGWSTYFVAGLPNADGDWIGNASAALDPELESLLANGGFAPDHRPATTPGSLVIDQGSCPGSGGDQRGYGNAMGHVRVVDLAAVNAAGGDGCDIGAHERGGVAKSEPELFADGFETGHTLYWRVTP